MDRGPGGPNDPNAQPTSSTIDPQRRSKRPRTERAHIIFTILMPAERERQAALHTDPHEAADGASSSSAASLPGSAGGLLPGGQRAADTRPRGPAADQRPGQGVAGRTLQAPPPPKAGRNNTGSGHGHRPADQLGPYAKGLPTLAATGTKPPGGGGRAATTGARRARLGADEEMTETSSPQNSGGSPPTAASCSMPQQPEPSTGNVPEGPFGTTPGHPSPTGTTPYQDRETMPPPAPRPPQRRNPDDFEDAKLRAVYDIYANTPSSGLVAALQEYPQDVDPNRLFALVTLPHAATTDIFVRQLQALVSPGMQISDDLVETWIWWFNANQPDHGGVWVPHLGWAHTLIAPPTDPRPAPSTGRREWAAPPSRANTLNMPPYKDLADWESRTAGDRGRNLRDMVERYPPGAETARAGPPQREGVPSTIAMIVLESAHYYQVRITPHPQECHWSLEAVNSILVGERSPARQPHPPAPKPAPRPPDGHRVGGSRHLTPRPCPVLPLAVGSAPLLPHQGLDGHVEVPPGRPAAIGGHPPTRADGGDPRSNQPVPRFRDPRDPGAGNGRATAARHLH